MPFFSSQGWDTHALSLRGTSKSPATPGTVSASLKGATSHACITLPILQAVSDPLVTMFSHVAGHRNPSRSQSMSMMCTAFWRKGFSVVESSLLLSHTRLEG